MSNQSVTVRVRASGCCSRWSASESFRVEECSAPLIASPRSRFRPEAAEYAQRLGKALDRMAEEDRRIDKNLRRR